MRTEPATVAIRVVPAIAEIGRETWDACANPGWCGGKPGPLESGFERRPYNPFVSFDFLQALEESGTVSARSGWTPRHLLLDGEDGPAAVMPCYLKSHSQGEYVFDWGWADAYERAGGRYYPKLQVSVPFTPVTGPRLLARAGPGAAERKQMLTAGLIELCRRLGASSAHLTFLSDEDRQVLGDMGFLERTDQQFHWRDDGYGDFDGFLAALASRKRKAIRKERRDALADGVSIEWVTGRDITESALGQLFRLLHGYGLAQMGAPLPQPPLLLAASASAWPTACCSSWPSARAAILPGR